MISFEDMETTKRQMQLVDLPQNLDANKAFTSKFVEAYHQRQK